MLGTDEQPRKAVALMRERLIEVMVKASEKFDELDCTPNQAIEILADYLLANGVIVPPCKVGDTVYFETYTNNGSTSIGVQPHKIIAYRLRMVTESNCLIPDFENGKTVFLTKEEAEAALVTDKNVGSKKEEGVQK